MGNVLLINNLGEELEIPEENKQDLEEAKSLGFEAAPQESDLLTVYSPEQDDFLEVPHEKLEEVAEFGYRPMTGKDAARMAEQEKEELAADMPVTAAAAGALRGATFGASDVAATKVLGIKPETLKKLKDANPWASTIGEVAGAVAPIVASGGAGGATSIAAKLPTSVVSRSAVPIAEKALGRWAGKTGAKVLAQAGEGAIYGTGMTISEEMMDDNPDLLGESVGANIGLGAIVGGVIPVVGRAVRPLGQWATSVVRKKPIANVSQVLDSAHAVRNDIDDALFAIGKEDKTVNVGNEVWEFKGMPTVDVSVGEIDNLGRVRLTTTLRKPAVRKVYQDDTHQLLVETDSFPDMVIGSGDMVLAQDHVRLGQMMVPEQLQRTGIGQRAWKANRKALSKYGWQGKEVVAQVESPVVGKWMADDFGAVPVEQGRPVGDWLGDPRFLRELRARNMTPKEWLSNLNTGRLSTQGPTAPGFASEGADPIFGQGLEFKGKIGELNDPGAHKFFRWMTDKIAKLQGKATNNDPRLIKQFLDPDSNVARDLLADPNNEKEIISGISDRLTNALNAADELQSQVVRTNILGEGPVLDQQRQVINDVISSLADHPEKRAMAIQVRDGIFQPDQQVNVAYSFLRGLRSAVEGAPVATRILDDHLADPNNYGMATKLFDALDGLNKAVEDSGFVKFDVENYLPMADKIPLTVDHAGLKQSIVAHGDVFNREIYQMVENISDFVNNAEVIFADSGIPQISQAIQKAKVNNKYLHTLSTRSVQDFGMINQANKMKARETWYDKLPLGGFKYGGGLFGGLTAMMPGGFGMKTGAAIGHAVQMATDPKTLINTYRIGKKLTDPVKTFVAHVVKGAAKGTREVTGLASTVPAATILSQWGVGGKKDASAAESIARIGDQLTQATEDPDTVAAITDAVGQVAPSGDAAKALVGNTLHRANYLKSKLPVNSLKGTIHEGKWMPSFLDVNRFARILRYVDQPLSIIEDAANGSLTNEGIEVLQQVWPQVYVEIQSAVMNTIEDIGKLPIKQQKTLYRLIGLSTDKPDQIVQSVWESEEAKKSKAKMSPEPMLTADRIEARKRSKATR